MNDGLLLPLMIEVANEQDLTDPNVREGIYIGRFASEVGKLGESGRAAVPTLIEILQSRRESTIRQLETNALQSLERIGAGAEEALPTLLKLRKEVSESSNYRDQQRLIYLKLIDRAIRRIQDSTHLRRQ
jgi:hypothetical protein